MKKFIISLIMLAASAAVFAEIKHLDFNWEGEKYTAYFNDSRTKYFTLSEIADYATTYLLDSNYDYEQLDCLTAELYENVYSKLLQDLLLKYNYVSYEFEDNMCIEIFMLNAYDDICVRIWKLTEHTK